MGFVNAVIRLLVFLLIFSLFFTIIGRKYIDSSDLYPVSVQFSNSRDGSKVGYIKDNSSGFWPSIIRVRYSRLRDRESLRSGSFSPVIIAPRFNYAGMFDDYGMAIVTTDEGMGFINKTGKYLIKPEFDSISDFDDNELAIVLHEGLKGLMRRDGVIPTEIIYDEIWSIDGKYRTKSGEEYGFLDVNGSPMALPVFNESREIVNTDSLWIVKTGEKWAIFDLEKEKLLFEPEFDSISYDIGKNGLLAASISGKWGYIDIDGVWQILPSYDGALDFVSGSNIAPVWLNEKYGFVNTAGELVVDCRFDSLGLVRGGAGGGFVRVINARSDRLVDCRYGLVSPDGEVVLEAVYEKLDNMGKDGLFLLRSNHKYGMADKQGKIVVPFKYDVLFSYENGFARFAEGRYENECSFGFLNKNGEIAFEAIYDQAGDFSDEGIAEVELNGKKYYLSADGSLQSRE